MLTALFSHCIQQVRYSTDLIMKASAHDIFCLLLQEVRSLTASI